MKRLLIVLLMFGLSGCGTMVSQRIHDKSINCGSHSISSIYGGTRMDVLAFQLIRDFSAVDPPASSMLWVLAPLPVIDVPLSFAADTVLLPFTVPQHFANKRRCKS